MYPKRFSTGLLLPVYTQEKKSEMKTARFGHVSGGFESGILSGNSESG